MPSPSRGDWNVIGLHFWEFEGAGTTCCAEISEPFWLELHVERRHEARGILLTCCNNPKSRVYKSLQGWFFNWRHMHPLKHQGFRFLNVKAYPTWLPVAVEPVAVVMQFYGGCPNFGEPWANQQGQQNLWMPQVGSLGSNEGERCERCESSYAANIGESGGISWNLRYGQMAAGSQAPFAQGKEGKDGRSKGSKSDIEPSRSLIWTSHVVAASRFGRERKLKRKSKRQSKWKFKWTLGQHNRWGALFKSRYIYDS